MCLGLNHTDPLSPAPTSYVIDQIFSALNHDEKLERIHSQLEAVRQRLDGGQVTLAELAITKEVRWGIFSVFG